MKKISVVTLALVLSGCLAYESEHAKDMGLTVDQMVREQTHNLDAATTNKVVVVTETDGGRVANAVENYRKDVPNLERVGDTIRINVVD